MPGDAVVLALGAPAQRAPAPQSRGSGRLSTWLVAAQHNPFPLGVLCLKCCVYSYTCTPAFTVCQCLHVCTGAYTHLCVCMMYVAHCVDTRHTWTQYGILL